MAETSIFCKLAPLEAHRASIVSKMVHISSIADCISRSCLTLAIPIFDKYERMCPMAVLTHFKLQEDHWLIAVTCLGLAFKFQRGIRFNYGTLFKAVPSLSQSDEIIAKISKLQMMVFQGIKWQIPTQTAFDTLQEVIPSFDNCCHITRQQIVASLKILMTAYSLGPQASLNPHLGAEIFHIIQNRRGCSPEAQQLYKKCVRYLKTQHKQNLLKLQQSS